MNFENICTPQEAEFLLNNLKSTDNVLEYGSGTLSMQIAHKVKHISVITHDINQFGDIITSEKPENLEILHVPTNKAQISEDGTYEEFEYYIKAGMELRKRFGKFNVIIIRGRARVECAKFAPEISQEACKIFVQDYAHPNADYTRHEYYQIENYLQRNDGVFTMYLFNVKQQLQENNTANAEIVETPKAEQKYVRKKITELPKKEQKRVKAVAKEITKKIKK